MELKAKRKTIILFVLILLLVMALIFTLHRCRDEPITPPETTESKTLDFVPANDNENGKITIPGVTGLNLQHGQFHQTVNFYNPENNNCYFVISLYLSDDTLIYKSDYIAPGEKITEIDLLSRLEKGVYQNCIMSYECYTLDDKNELNGTRNKIEINSR